MPAANAGVSTRPAAATAATTLAPLRCATLSTNELLLLGDIVRTTCRFHDPSRFISTLLPTQHNFVQRRLMLAGEARASITPPNPSFDPQGPSMTRPHKTAAALLVLALATPGCTHNKTIPNRLAPSQVTTLAINSYLWRAAERPEALAPVAQANTLRRDRLPHWD